MKKFLIIVGLIGAFILLILCCIELWVRSIPNEYSYKHQYLEENIGSIRVLNVGSSIGRSGFNPVYFSVHGFNAANVSQDIETDCAIINKYLDKADSLKTVIFALLPGSFCGRMGDGIESWRLRKYHIYMDLDVEKPSWKECLEINNLSAAEQQILKSLRGVNTVDCNRFGYGNDKEAVSEKEKLAQGIRISKLHNEGYNPKLYDIIVPKVESTVAACKDRNIKVLFVMLPSYHTYTSRINQQMLEECDSIAKTISEEHDNVLYINLFTDTLFKTEDFRNSNHLSNEGAKKLTKMIDNIICSNE